MKLEELLNSQLKKVNDENKKHSLKWLLLTMLNISNTEYFLKLDEKVNEKIISEYIKNVDKFLNENIPVQYLANKTFFYNNDFYINENVLIPRKETEELIFKSINYINKHFNNNTNLNLLDLATGSGIIGLTLKEELPNLNITMSDISEGAIKVANKNKERLNLNTKIIKSDWFSNINKKFDIIISNPPYISNNYKLDKHVLKEPKLALYSGDEGLDSYKIILKDIKKYLNNKFLICFEHGYDQKEKIKKIIKTYLEDVLIIQEKDLNNQNRFTFVLSKED